MTQRVTRYVRLVIDASGAKSGGREVTRALRDIDRSVKQTTSHLADIKRAFAAAFAYVGVRELVGMADGWKLMSGRLKNATGSAEAAAVVQQKLLDVANNARAPLESASAVYTRLAAATEHLGLGSQTLVDVTEAVALSFRVGGASASEASAAAIQLAQGLGSASLAGDELKSIMENNIPLAKAIAAEFGVNVTQLKDLGKEGQLTADKVIPAILKGLETFREQAANLPETIGGAFVVLKNELTAYIGGVDNATGVSSAIATVIVTLAKNLDTVAAALSGLAVVAIPKVIAGLQILGRIIAVSPIGRLVTIIGAAAAGLNELAGMTIEWGEHTATAGGVFSVVMSDALGWLQSVGSYAGEFFAWIGGELSALAENFGITFAGFSVTARDAFNIVIASGKSFVDAFVSFFRAVGAAGAALWEGLAESTQIYVGAVVSALSGDFTGAFEKLKGVGSAFDWSEVAAELEKGSAKIGENLTTDFFAEWGFDEYVNSVMERAAARTGEASAGLPPGVGGLGGGGGGGGGGKGKGSGKSDADKLAEDYKRLEESLLPVLAAERELEGVRRLLAEATATGLVSEERAAELLTRKREEMAASLDPLQAVNELLNQEIELARMTNEERAIETELRRHILDLQKEGITLSGEEVGKLREKITEMERLRAAQDSSKKTGQTFGEGMQETLGKAEGAFGALASAAEDGLGRQSAAYRAAFAMSKAASLASAIVNTAEAVTEALAEPPPLNYVNAALVGAAGAAQIATIAATAIAGFQAGGFTGGGARDEIKGYVHAGEFVMPSGQTQQYRGELEAMRAGRYAPANASTAPAQAPVVNVIADGLGPVDVQERQTPDGGLEIRLMRRMRAEIARDIREGGGDIDAALTRSGRRRGA